MKKLLIIVLISILFSCTNTGIKLSDLKPQFINENPEFIDFDKLEELAPTEVTDAETVRFLANTIYPEKQDLDIQELTENSTFRLYTYNSANANFNRYMIFHIQNCIGVLFSIMTDKSGKIKDINRTMEDNTCERNYQFAVKFDNSGNFTVESDRIEHQKYFLPERKIQEYTLSAEGKIISGPKQELIPGVCLWEKLAVRENPSDQAKYLSSLTLGESIWGLNETKTDEVSSKKNTYSKILLSDGSVGWSRSDLLAFNTIPMAIETEATIYKRPDVLTKTDLKFSSLDIIAASQMDGEFEWVKVKGKPSGEKWFKEGWIKWHNAVQGKENIALAVFAKSIQAETDKNSKSEQLASVLNNEDLQDETLFTAFQKKFGVYGDEEQGVDESPIGEFLNLFPTVELPYTAEYPDLDDCTAISMEFKTQVLGLSEEDAGYLDYCAHAKVIGDYVDLVFVGDNGMNNTIHLFTFTKDGQRKDQFRVHHMTIPNAPEREELKTKINEDFSIELNFWSGKWVDENGNDSDGSMEGDTMEEVMRIGKYVVADDGSVLEMESSKVESKGDLPLFK